MKKSKLLNYLLTLVVLASTMFSGLNFQAATTQNNVENEITEVQSQDELENEEETLGAEKTEELNEPTLPDADNALDTESLPEVEDDTKGVGLGVTFGGIAFSSEGAVSELEETLDILSGSDVLARTAFGVSATGNVLPGQLLFRIELPANSNFSVSQSDIYTFSRGGENSPEDPEVPGGKEYIWVAYKNTLAPGDGKSFSFSINPSKNGVTPDNTAYPIKISAYAAPTMKKLSETSNTLFARVPEFKWNPIDAQVVSGANFNSNGTANVPQISINYNATPSYGGTQTGIAYAGEINYQASYEVPFAEDGTTPYLQIKPENLIKNSGEVMVPNVDYIVDSKKGDFITRFTVLNRVESTNLDAEISPRSFRFHIRGAKLDTDLLITEYDLEANETSGAFTLNEVANTHTITPAYNVQNIGKTAQLVEQRNKPKVTFTFKNALETGDETNQQSKFRKDILRIGSTPTSGTSNASLAAYPNDLITYQIGSGFRNVQKNSLESLTFTEESGTSYNPTELAPISIDTGRYTIANAPITDDATVSLVLTVTYSDGTETKKVLSGVALNTSEKILIDETDTKKVEKIEYKFTHADAGFTVTQAPLLIFNTILQTDATKFGAKFTNEATMEYVYINQEVNNDRVVKQQKSSAYFFYKGKNTGVDGKYSSQKYADNLANKGNYPDKSGYVVQFDINFKNNDATPWDIKEIIDTYTYNLSLYDGDKVNTEDPNAADIDPQMLSSLPGNMTLWDLDDPTEKHADQTLLQVVDTPANNPQDGILAITFDGADGIRLNPGQTLRLTYTMVVNDEYVKDATLGNKFDAKDKDGRVKAKGSFYWGPKTVPPEYTERNRNKSWKNVSSGLSSSTPYPDDIIAYKITLKNETEADWTAPVKIVDSFDDFLVPIGGATHGGLDGINIDYEHYDKLNATNDLNLGVANSPSTFDIDEVTGTLDEAANELHIDLGTNVIKPGEEIELVYTLMIRGDARAGQSIYNNFIAHDALEEIGKGRSVVTIDKFTGKAAVIDYTLTAQALEDAEGITPELNALMDGDKVKYTGTMENYRNRPTDKAHVKNYHELLPDNLKYVAGTTKVYIITYDGENVILNHHELTEGSDFTVAYPFATDPTANTNTLDVKLSSSVELPGRKYRADQLEERTAVVFEYEAVIDVTSNDFPEISSTSARIPRSVKSHAMIVEPVDMIADAKSGGPITEDKDNIDNDAATLSFTSSSANISVLNNTRVFGNMTKRAIKNETLDLDSTETTRSYSIDLVNTNIVDWPVQKVIDLLPDYEEVDTTKPIEYKDHNGNTYQASYTVDTYTDANGKDIERLNIDGYIDASGVKQDLLVNKRGRLETNVQHQLIYHTNVDVVNAKKDMRTADNARLETVNRSAFYIDPTLNFSTANGRYDDGAGTENWDGVDETQYRYVASRSVYMETSYISPFVNIRAQKVIIQGNGVSEIYQNYNPGVTTVNPGDIIAWHLNLGNSNQSRTVPIEAGTPLVVMLPPGLTYEGYKWDASGNEIVPTFLSEPKFTKVNNSTVITWKTTEKINRGTDLNFGIRTATDDNLFATHFASAYFIPQSTELQYFYNSQLNNSSEYNRYSFRGETKDISHILPEAKGFTHYVLSQSQIDVYGELGVSSSFSVEDPSGNATPAKVTSVEAGSRVMTLADREDAVRYSMRLNVDNSIRGLTNPVFINRLPDNNDLTVLGDRARESEATMRVVGDGNFSAEVRHPKTNALISTLNKDTDYVVEYFFGGVDELFTPADWNGELDQARWHADGALDSEGLSTASAVRIRIIDPAFSLGDRQSFVVSYDAKLKDYKVGSRIAYNTFGYNGKLGQTLEVKSEPLYVGVEAPLFKDRVRVDKILLDNNDSPQLTTFEMELIGKDTDGVEAYRETITVETDQFVDTNGDGENDAWVGSEGMFELPLGLEYSVEEPAIEDYEAPIYDVESTLYPDGTTEWILTVTNQPKYYADITITTALMEKTDKPSAKQFVVDLVGTNAQGKEVTRTPYTITLSKQQPTTRASVKYDGLWVGELTLDKLDVTLDYSVEQKDAGNYKQTYAKEVIPVPYGKSWNFIIENELRPVDPNKDKDGNKLPTTGENNVGFLIGAVLLVTSTMIVVVRKKIIK